MSMEHTQAKRFIGKEIYQKSSCVSDIPSETYLPLLTPLHPSTPCQGHHRTFYVYDYDEESK